MLLLEWFLFVITAPFWFPVLLLVVGFFILLFGILLLSLLFVSLCSIIWILKNLYGIHIGLINARQIIFREIGNGINSDMSWWRMGRLIFLRYIKQRKENKEMQRQYAQEEREKEKEIVDDFS